MTFTIIIDGLFKVKTEYSAFIFGNEFLSNFYLWQSQSYNIFKISIYYRYIEY